ncbi:MAG: DNA-directed RNA polymerase subunit A' [Candidatus Diapherotrites archaeon]|nr:DNA-directed RNA polymerase subunit A' [Candidatus Diapherotrites archaeon]
MNMLTKRIEAIEFAVLSPDMIRKMSAIEIKVPDTYDKDGYPMEEGLMDPHLGVINPSLRCKTCGQKMKQCPGHFGSMELVRPVIHPKFSKNLETLLMATCRECGRIVLKDEQLKDIIDATKDRSLDDRVKILVKKTKAKQKCPQCNAERKQILLDKPTNFFHDKDRIYPTQIREWVEKIPSKDLELFGYEAERIRPEWFILTVLQVPPITIRPSITLDTGIKSEDDLTHKLVDVIRINARLKDNIEAGAPQLIIEDLWDLLQYHVTTYFDNNSAGVPPAKHRSGRSLRTLVQRLKGKKGRFRYNLTGKRVNYAARTIVTPDPFLSINEVGVPKEIANDLTIPEYVTTFNLEQFKKDIKNTNRVIYVTRPNGLRKKVGDLNKDEIIAELELGCKIERVLEDGDIVLFNRQPSLHRLSMMAHTVKVMPDRTIHMNPTVCRPYNADFDGDEMNLHVPQTAEGKAEARELMYVQDQIISPRHGGPVITLMEDGVSGLFLLTLKSTEFTPAEAMNFFYEIGLTDIPKPDRGKNYSGRLVFSQILPKNFNIEFPSYTSRLLLQAGLIADPKEDKEFDSYVRIENGKLVTGIIDQAALGEGTGRIIDVLAREYPKDVLEKFYRDTNRLAVYMVTRTGITVGLDEFEPSETVLRAKEDAVREELLEAEELVRKLKSNQLEPIPGRQVQESFEIYMLRLGAKQKSKVEKQIISEKIREVIGRPRPKYNTTTMILSGARGGMTNLTNLMGLWGQASVREGRPRRGYKKRLITINKPGDVGAIAGGFIQHNFMEGMKVREYFYHSMGGRQGEVDTGVSTKVSGYLYRRLANSLKDLVVNYDGTVRTANKNIIQLVYGEDGVFPAKTKRGKVDIKELLRRSTQKEK